MGWDKYIELENCENGSNSYDTYYSKGGFMILSGYDEEKSRHFLNVVEAEVRFDKDGKPAKQLGEMIAAGDLEPEALTKSGIAFHYAALTPGMNKHDMAEDIGASLANGQTPGYAINRGFLKQYGYADDAARDGANSRKTADLVKNLQEKFPEGVPKKKSAPIAGATV